jgi:hypothetical protein
MYVADMMVKLVQHPKPAAATDVATPFLKVAYTLMPRLTRSIMEKVMSTYFKNAPAMPRTDGNVFMPVSYGNAIHGGWNSAVDSAKRRKVMLKGLMVAGVLAAGISLLKTKKQ